MTSPTPFEAHDLTDVNDIPEGWIREPVNTTAPTPLLSPPPGWVAPGMTISANYRAAAGRTENISLDFRDAPDADTIERLINRLAAIGDLQEVDTTVTPPAKPAPAEPARTLTARDLAIASGDCGAQGEGHDAPNHWCGEEALHDPVEPGGRNHRCHCGGMFMAPDEMPDVGRSPRFREGR